jgi:lysophospholipase L1-like esterase
MLNFDTPWLEKNDTLVCFGDSLTASKEGYVKILEGKLKKLKIKIINAGVGGDKTPTALTRLKSDVIDLKPDAVSIFFGANDAAVGRGIWSDEPRIDHGSYKSNLIWIVHLCRLSGIKKFSISTPAGNYEGEEFVNSGGVMSSYCIGAREAADEIEARLVPLDAAFSLEWQLRGAEAKAGLLLTRDGVHMTPEGNQLIASTMLKAWKLA